MEKSFQIDVIRKDVSIYRYKYFIFYTLTFKFDKKI